MILISFYPLDVIVLDLAIEFDGMLSVVTHEFSAHLDFICERLSSDRICKNETERALFSWFDPLGCRDKRGCPSKTGSRPVGSDPGAFAGVINEHGNHNRVRH